MGSRLFSVETERHVVVMKKLFYVLTLTFAVALSAATSSGTQTRRNRATTAAPPANAQATTRVLASLPASDAVMVVDVRRLLSEALPRAFNNDAAELARVNSEIDKFKAETGLDARLFERVAVGVSYQQTTTGSTLVETVAIARGTFKPGALAAAPAAAAASGNQMRVQKYAGKSIYVYNVNSQVKLLGLFNLRVSDVAVSVLDANTVAIGKLERVRAAIDANAGRGRVSPEIATLATRDANAIIGMGGDVPASLTQKLDIGNISKSIAAVRQFYSTLGTTAGGFNLLTALRTDNAGAAKSLSSTLTGLKQLAPFAIGQMTPARARPLQSLVENTKVNAEGNDVLITLELAQVNVAALIASF